MNEILLALGNVGEIGTAGVAGVAVWNEILFVLGIVGCCVMAALWFVLLKELFGISE